MEKLPTNETDLEMNRTTLTNDALVSDEYRRMLASLNTPGEDPIDHPNTLTRTIIKTAETGENVQAPMITVEDSQSPKVSRPRRDTTSANMHDRGRARGKSFSKVSAEPQCPLCHDQVVRKVSTMSRR